LQLHVFIALSLYFIILVVIEKLVAAMQLQVQPLALMEKGARPLMGSVTEVGEPTCTRV
jgi:hypothetical protein